MQAYLEKETDASAAFLQEVGALGDSVKAKEDYVKK